MKTIILAGSGHAHLEIIKSLSKRETSENQFILISPNKDTYYSGLIPSLIAGKIEANNLTIKSAEFAEAQGIHFIQDLVQSVDQEKSSLTLAGGKILKFDLLSMNIGGEVVEMISKLNDEIVYLRPLDAFLKKWSNIQRIYGQDTSPRFIVVGGGAAAVEVATALRIHLNNMRATSGEIHLISKGPRLCENYSEKVSAAIITSLIKLNISVYLNEYVEEIVSKTLNLKNGTNIEFDSIFVVTPTRPSKLLTGGIDSKLRYSNNIFAAGDAAIMTNFPRLPRSGVIAVHQGRHLAQSIRKFLEGLCPKDFIIPQNQLNILISGHKTARLVWGSFSIEGNWPFRIKNWIDERYINSFN